MRFSAALPASPARTAACITFVPPNAKPNSASRKKFVGRDLGAAEQRRRAARLADLADAVVGASAAWRTASALPGDRGLDLGWRQSDRAGLAGQAERAQSAPGKQPVDHARRDRAEPDLGLQSAGKELLGRRLVDMHAVGRHPAAAAGQISLEIGNDRASPARRRNGSAHPAARSCA